MQAYKEYQGHIAYQVAIRLVTSPHIKDGQEDLVVGKGSHKQAEESETAPASTVRSPITKPSYTTIRYMQRTYIRPM